MVKKHCKNGLMLCVFLLAMFFLGRSIGAIAFGLHLQREMSIRETAGSALENTQALLSAENWGLGFGSEGTQPSGTASSDKLKEYNAYYVGDAEEKKIYLTFDCGYENGNSSAILDALKRHNAPATFFVVGHFLESAPEMVKRIGPEIGRFSSATTRRGSGSWPAAVRSCCAACQDSRRAASAGAACTARVWARAQLRP